MEKVFLRVYDREIESMIEGGQLDEAVAHCQQILKTFPMHVETYRLLGKTFLEARRYTDAADIFQRILMAVPDDFVSHVGMSIICDDEGKLDDAIWHMERAFEVQPSNSAIQGELRRLYGRRDGVEPSKIRLSRDALANMYSQGELFNQAIAEIRSVLADDPNRPDLQVMLMRAYYRSAQKVEAAEIAANLLKKYPYCLDSLRVLVDVLPGTARAENIQVYRHRMLMLDPYSAFTTDAVFSSEQVADSAVNLERLDYRPGATPGSPPPDWESSLGIKLNKDKRPEPPPEWMQTPEIPENATANTPEPSEPAPEPEPAVNPSEDAIPDWMRASGWRDSTGEGKSDSADAGVVPPDESIAKANIPDWLMSMAPAHVNEAENTVPEEPSAVLPTGDEGIPDWLKPITQAEGTEEAKIESQASVDSASKSGEEAIAPSETIEAKPKEPQEPVESPSAISKDVSEGLKLSTPAEAVGETLNEPQTPMVSQPERIEKVPDVPKAITPAETAGETIAETQAPVESQPERIEEVLDWFKATTAAETAGETISKTREPVEPQPASGENIPDWLRSMAPAETIGETLKEPQEPVESQPAISENIPDWIRSMAPVDETKSNVKSEPSFPEVPTGEHETEPTPAETTSAGAEALPDWLTGMGDQAAAAATPTTETLGQQTTSGQPVPEQPVPEEPVTQAPVKPPVSKPDRIGKSFQPTGGVKPLDIRDDTLGWLENLAAKQGAKPEELLTNPQDRSVETPDWLRQPEEQPVEAPAAPVQEPVRTPPETLPLEPQGRFDSTSASLPGQPIEEAFPVQDEVRPSESPAEAVAQPAGKPASGEEDTMSWLERLSAGQEKAPEEPLLSPEENPEIPTGENQQLSEEQPAVQVPVESTLVSSKPATDEDITITSWLNRLDVEEALGKKLSKQPSEEMPAVPEEELPDWLKGLETPITPVETAKAGDDLPEWLRQPISPAGPEMTSEAEVPTWVDENIPVSGQALPTKPEEWIPTEVKPESGVEPETIPESGWLEENQPSAEPEPVDETKPIPETEPLAKSEPVSEPVSFSVQTLIHPPTLKQTGMLSAVPVQDKDAELLSNAQTVLDQDSLDESMKQYMKLIKKGRLLDEVIHDLREAIYRYPVDVIIWQTLGDAYMRANRLQDALDAYTKAEELLR